MRVLALLSLCIGLLACKQQDLPPKSSDQTKQIRYLALGDSYTIGESVEADSNFPNQLASRLNKLAKYEVLETLIIAQTGWRTDNLIQAIRQEAPDSNFQLVTLLIGVNNFFQNRPIQQYEEEFEILLQGSVAHAEGNKAQVLVLSIPDYGYSPYGQSGDPEEIGRKTDQYNALAAQICQQYGVRFISITGISRDLDLALIAKDGLHPSAFQYQLWVEELVKVLSD